MHMTKRKPRVSRQDRRDSAIARKMLREIRENPKLLITGKALEARMRKLGL